MTQIDSLTNKHYFMKEILDSKRRVLDYLKGKADANLVITCNPQSRLRFDPGKQK
jgi:hypothetical protein